MHPQPTQTDPRPVGSQMHGPLRAQVWPSLYTKKSVAWFAVFIGCS